MCMNSCSSALFLGIIVVISMAIGPVVQAHETKTDTTVSALLHIVPNDDPYINEPAYLLLEFTDTQKQFLPEQCMCTISISQGDTELYSASISDEAVTKTPHSISFPYTFPKFGIYILTLRGIPQEGEQFQPFTFSYDIVVDEERSFSLHHYKHHIVHGAIVIGALVVLAVVLIQDRLERRKNLNNS